MQQQSLSAIVTLNLLLFPFCAWSDDLLLPSMMRSGHIMPHTSTFEAWGSMDVFDQSFDVINYTKKLGNSAKPSRMNRFNLGGNVHINDQWVIRAQLSQGQQTIVRQQQPKSIRSTFHTEQALLQWHANRFPLVIEGGYIQNTYPASGFSSFQTGNVTITAAPGKQILVASSKASTWLIGASMPLQISEHARIHAGFEYQTSKVQSHYTSYDPFIQSRIGAQAPQTTPWREKQSNLFISFDYQWANSAAIGLDVKQVHIQRSQYIPRKGFQDYNQTQIIDLWLSYDINSDLSLIFRGHANTHYILGENPAAYNRRINHKFKYPFGFLSIGLDYR